MPPLWEEVKDKLQETGAASRAASSSGCASRVPWRCAPEVILFDEPTAALDPISTLRIEETLQSLRERYCIAVVTHNLQQAARVSNVTAFMYLGELVEIARRSRIFTAPKHRAR